MKRTIIDGAAVAWTDSGGDGEPMLLLHGGGLADWLTPLAGRPELASYRVIRMVRAGQTDGPAPAGLTIADHARHAATLLRQLDAEPAHLVAHSAGAAIALQLAADNPDSVRTLSLCEPPLVDPLADPADLDEMHALLGPAIGAAMGAAAAGDFPSAFDTFMAAVCGPGYRKVMDDVLGAGVVDDEAKRPGFFTGEIPAFGAWSFDLAAVTRPVLLIQGGDSLPAEHRLIAYLAGRLPETTVVTVDGTNHLMPLTAPAELAAVVSRWLTGHAR